MLTEEEIAKYRSGLSPQSMVDVENVSFHKKKLTPADVLQIYSDSRTYNEIIESFDFTISRATISHIKTGKTWNEVTHHNANQRPVRLSREEILQIFYGCGSMEQLAQQFGVHKNTIWKIKMRKLHAHITRRPPNHL